MKKWMGWLLVNGIFGALSLLAPQTAQAQSPTCPTGVNHCAQVSWTAGTGGGAATGFNIYRANATGGCATVTAPSCTKVGSVTGSVTTFLDSPLAATTTYFWVVTAFNASGESGPSSEVSATTGQDPAPVPPTGVTVTAK